MAVLVPRICTRFQGTALKWLDSTIDLANSFTMSYKLYHVHLRNGMQGIDHPDDGILILIRIPETLRNSHTLESLLG